MRFILLIALFLMSCSKKEDIIPPDKMEHILWDYVQADVYTNEFLKKDTCININADSNHLVILKGIFERHHTNKEDFYRSYTYYLKNPDLLTPVLDSIVAKQTRSRIKLTKTKKTGYE